MNPKRRRHSIGFIAFIGLMLIAWFFVFYPLPKLIFSLTFNPVNVLTNGTVRMEDKVIELDNINDFILVESLSLERPIQYHITISGGFLVNQNASDDVPLFTIETANLNHQVNRVFDSFPYSISGIIDDRYSTFWMLRLTNFATIENESLPYGIIISMITLMHINR